MTLFRVWSKLAFHHWWRTAVSGCRRARTLILSDFSVLRGNAAIKVERCQLALGSVGYGPSETSPIHVAADKPEVVRLSKLQHGTAVVPRLCCRHGARGTRYRSCCGAESRAAAHDRRCERNTAMARSWDSFDMTGKDLSAEHVAGRGQAP